MSQEGLSYEIQLEELESQLRTTKQKGGKPSTDLCVKILKTINEAPFRRPDLVVECGRVILDSKSSLGDQGNFYSHL
jgi:hypothetical protein